VTSKWQDEVTPQEWANWMKIAVKISGARRANTSLGPSEYASQAIEKLLVQKKRPPHIESWLTTTIKNLYIDRFRHKNAFGGIHKADLDDEQWEYEMVKFAVRSPSTMIGQRDQIKRILELLTVKECELLVMATAGYDNHAIAEELGYATNKVVATRLRQISQKVETLVQQALIESFKN
jgi:DNA-directed RNA polymerase specialized sigma24 family protein